MQEGGSFDAGDVIVALEREGFGWVSASEWIEVV